MKFDLIIKILIIIFILLIALAVIIKWKWSELIMNIELIKELFDEISTGTGLSYSGDRTISRSEAQSILDYITNLQEENEHEKEHDEKMLKTYKRVVNLFKKDLITMSNLYTEEKSRNEKAIKYNYELQERYCHSALFDELVASKIYEITEKQLNILTGGNKDE